MYFTEDDLKRFYRLHSTIDEQYKCIMDAYSFRIFSNEKAKEYATHGFLRRIKTLKRCIHNIYTICPPEIGTKPTSDELSDLAINLQSFVFNIYGCLDNIAWIWVSEKDVRDDKGVPIKKEYIGLRKENKLVRNSFSQEFRTYLDTLTLWFNYLEKFRHSLAHRIPLYVPPYVVSHKEAAEIAELEKLERDALRRYNFTEYEALSEKKDRLGTFRPWMTHSFSEQSPQIVFHAQILDDWNQVMEISEKFIEQLDSNEASLTAPAALAQV